MIFSPCIFACLIAGYYMNGLNSHSISWLIYFAFAADSTSRKGATTVGSKGEALML